MASVTVNLLNKRQLKVLSDKNEKWRQDGLIPNDVVFYHHCNRCEDLGIGLRFQPIENFTFHGSRPDGVSGYCTKCTNSGLNKYDSDNALLLMQASLQPARNGELVVKDRDGAWRPVSEISDAKDVVRTNMLRHQEELLDADKPAQVPPKESWFNKLVLMSIMGAVLWILIHSIT